MCFFEIVVPTKSIPIGTQNDEGELIWLHKDMVLTSGYELVDDLNYLWTELSSSRQVLFVGLEVGDDEKILSCKVTRL
jgi:hypothetical protein